MTNLPPGWEWTTLGEICQTGSGGTPKAGTTAYYHGHIPWAVIGDLDDGEVTRTLATITDEGLRNSSAKLVPPGTVLMAMYGSIGKLGIAGVEMATNQAIVHFLPTAAILSDFLYWFLLSQRPKLLSQGKGATQKNISQTLVKNWPVPLPPASEQRRMVEEFAALRPALDTCERSLEVAETRARDLKKRVLSEVIPNYLPPQWKETTVGRAGRVELGMARHPTRHTGPNMKPYLRVANVFEDEFRLDDVKEMHFSLEEFQRYALHPGDVLLNEGQSPELLGRPALWLGEANRYAFTNSLLRFQPGEGVMSRWALLCFRHHLHSGRFVREVRITTNIAHLSASRFKNVEFAVPPLTEQRRICDEVDDEFARIDALTGTVRRARHRARTLWSAVLTQVLRGELTDQDAADEPASALLERIRAERATAAPAKPARRRPSRSPTR